MGVTHRNPPQPSCGTAGGSSHALRPPLPGLHSDIMHGFPLAVLAGTLAALVVKRRSEKRSHVDRSLRMRHRRAIERRSFAQTRADPQSRDDKLAVARDAISFGLKSPLAAVEELANSLGVPVADYASFVEWHNQMSLRANASGSKLMSATEMRDWQKVLEGRPAEAQVRAFIAEIDDEIAEFVNSHNMPRRSFEQQLLFTCVYGETPDEHPLPFNIGLKHVMDGIIAAKRNDAPRDTSFSLQLGSFSDAHVAIRTAAFPYRPASTTQQGDTTIDCYANGNLLVGYISFTSSGYIDNLAVLPAWQGRGIATRLIGEVARHLSAHGVQYLYLHVRAANYPAINIYKKLGFSVTEHIFPGVYDWHGGYSMSNHVSRVAAHISEKRS